MSQRALAAAMNDRGFGAWVQSTVTKTEAGERPLRLNEALTLCAVVGLDAAQTIAQLSEVETPQQRAARENREAHRIVQGRIDEVRGQLRDLEAVEGDLAEKYELILGDREPTLEDFYSQPSEDDE